MRSAALRVVPPWAEPPPCGVCRAAPGEPHTRGCPVPIVFAEAHPELWRVERHWSTREADAVLESCTRRALEAWVRGGRTIQ